MLIIKKPEILQQYLDASEIKKLSRGFVPTMGALHAGHISLLHIARSNSELVICSVFVNPTQFNNPADLAKYPRTLEKDIDQLEENGCDLLFLPEEKDIYPSGEALQHYDLGSLENILEGEYRPGHFQGVCQVVDKLLRLVRPQILFLGQKDFQQCKVLQKMVDDTGSGASVQICPTVREPDGLAMSSRNLRLGKNERAQATGIFQTLTRIQEEITPGPMEKIKSDGRTFLEQKGFRVDYVEIADSNNLQTIDSWDGKQKAVILIAASLGEIRLIDNLVLN